MAERPDLTIERDPDAVTEFVQGLQAAIDAGDAVQFNDAFAGDVLWGSPFGMVVDGYDDLHAIHSSMFRPPADGDAGSRYEIEHARLVAEDVAVAYVRRLARTPIAVGGDEQPGDAAAFDELALFVLVRRDGRWWLSAGLHTPDRRHVYG